MHSAGGFGGSSSFFPKKKMPYVPGGISPLSLFLGLVVALHAVIIATSEDWLHWRERVYWTLSEELGHSPLFGESRGFQFTRIWELPSFVLSSIIFDGTASSEDVDFLLRSPRIPPHAVHNLFSSSSSSSSSRRRADGKSSSSTTSSGHVRQDRIAPSRSGPGVPAESSAGLGPSPGAPEGPETAAPELRVPSADSQRGSSDRRELREFSWDEFRFGLDPAEFGVDPFGVDPRVPTGPRVPSGDRPGGGIEDPSSDNSLYVDGQKKTQKADFLYLSIFGVIFDVSTAPEFYGDGGTYDLFHQHDC
eukprot:gene469-190_t